MKPAYSKQTFETYHVHFDTPNTSFIKMALLLQEMGVTNWHFHLKLFDKGLDGVDPYDPDLDDEMKVRVFKECANNRWYFYREVFRVSENGAGTGVGGGSPFILNRGNMAYLWAMELNISTYLIMPRQTGKTWSAIADATWTHQFVRGSTILHFNKNQKDANDNLGRIQAAIRMLPIYLQHSNPDVLDGAEKRRVKNNEKTMKNIIDATIEAMASAGNESKADAMARGRTASKIWWDELAFIFFNETIYSAATPAYEKATELAIKNHAPHAISITTTPGDLATPHGAFAYKMMNDSIKFDESFYNLSYKKLMDVVENTPDKIPFLFIQYSYLQLGETEEWYLKRYKKLHNPIRARREYLLEWMNSNGNSPFDPDDIDLIGELSRQTEQKMETFKLNKYFDLHVYDTYHGKKPVLIGVDVSGSLGRDSSAIVVVNPETLHPIAIFKSNMIEASKLRKLITTLVTKMYPNCILTIENNSVGNGLISELKETPVCRVLYKEKKQRTIDQGANAITKKRKTTTIEYGHNTNTVTRPQMMETLEAIVHNSPAHMGYPELYEEVRLLELKNGRIDHGSSSHDDVVMAYMGVLWIVRYGKGLKGKGIYYNITDGMDDYEEIKYDTAQSHRIARRLLKKRQQSYSDPMEEANDELLDFMLRDHHVQTSEDLAHAETMEMFRGMDHIDDIDTDEGSMQISETTQNLLLQNYNAMLRMDPYSDDPVSQLIHPVGTLPGSPFGFDPRQGADWSSLYEY
ncbi:MAG: hypothetical protein NC311_06380 [Muribaculaceae bacterium]|nr:hypothetical protein [Muribaculaceae bacterium]